MKTFALLLVAFGATPAFADNVRANIKDHYVWQEVSTPVVKTRCKNTSSGQTALEGMIIGGLLGKGVTGSDQGAAAGAVLGGVIGADKGGRRCWDETTYHTERVKMYSYSTITFTEHGRQYTLNFTK